MPGCSAIGCKNRSEHGYLMKRFPRDPRRRALWQAEMDKNRPGWKATPSSFLCEVHFEAHYWIKTPDGRKLLKFDAAPKIFSPNAARPKITVTSAIHTKYDKILNKIQDENIISLLKMKDDKLLELEESLRKAREDIFTQAYEIEDLKRNTTHTPELNFFLLKNHDKKPAPSATAAKPSQPKFEPEVVIKEEPIDIDEHPVPSTSRTDQEFILPCSDSLHFGSTPTVGETFTIVKTEPVEEHQVITSNGKKTKSSQKKTSKKAHVAEQSLPVEGDSAITENKSAKNHLDAYGEYIAGELKMLDSKSCAHVQRVIADLLFDAKLGKFK